MSRFQFEIPDVETAREFVDWRRREEMYQGELHADALVCMRVLQPATSPDERSVNAAYVATPAYACLGCGRFAFPEPNTRCFWCRHEHRAH